MGIAVHVPNVRNIVGLEIRMDAPIDANEAVLISRR